MSYESVAIVVVKVIESFVRNHGRRRARREVEIDGAWRWNGWRLRPATPAASGPARQL